MNSWSNKQHRSVRAFLIPPVPLQAEARILWNIAFNFSPNAWGNITTCGNCAINARQAQKGACDVAASRAPVTICYVADFMAQRGRPTRAVDRRQSKRERERDDEAYDELAENVECGVFFVWYTLCLALAESWWVALSKGDAFRLRTNSTKRPVLFRTWERILYGLRRRSIDDVS